MATAIQQIFRGINAVTTSAQGAAWGDRAIADGRAVTDLLGVRTFLGGGESARRAIAAQSAVVATAIKPLRGVNAPVGSSWTIAKQAITRLYIEIEGARGIVEASTDTPLDVAWFARLLGDSVGWWESYGAELAKTTNVVERAGKVIGDATRATAKAAGNATAPALEGAGDLLLKTLKAAAPLLITVGVLVGVGAAVYFGGLRKAVPL